MCAYLGLDPGGVVTCELLLSGSRDQDVTVGFQNVPLVGLGSREANNGAIVLQKVQTDTQIQRRNILECFHTDISK